MKAHPFFRIIALLCCGLASLRAAEWPRAFEVCETLVLKDPGEGTAWLQLIGYATSADRIDELAQRWETRTTGGEGVKYRLMLAWLEAARKKPEAAREHLRQATAMAPESGLAWFATGKFELSQKQTEAAAAALERAAEIEIAGGTSRTGLLELAEYLSRTGNGAKALELLDRGWKGVGTDDARDTYLARWGNVALAAGQLGAMIARFEPAQRAGDAQAAADLAAIYLAASDSPLAARILEDARKLHPKDQRLRQLAISAARAAMNIGEEARLRREEAAATATPEAWRELFKMLVVNQANEAAGEVFDQHTAALIGPDGDWRSVLQLLRRLDRPVTGDFLERLKEKGGWEATLAYYEFLSEAREPEKAAEVLWDLFRPGVEQRPLSSDFLKRGNRLPGSRYPVAMEGANWSLRRSMSGAETGLPSQYGMGRDSWPPRSSTLQEVRDWALRQLAKSVSGTDRAGAFPDRLAGVIKDFPASERIFAWSVVENIEHLLVEIGAYLDAGAGNAKLDGYCRLQLGTISRLAQLEPVLALKTKGLLAKCPDSSPAPKLSIINTSIAAVQAAMSRNDLPLAAEKLEQAIDESPADREELLAGFMSLLSRPRYPYPVAPSRPVVGAADIVRAASLLGRATPRLSTPRSDIALWMHDLPMSRSGFPQNREPPSTRPKNVVKPVFPPGQLMPETVTSVLWNSTIPTPGGQSWPVVKANLDTVRKAFSGERAVFVRIATAYLSWWNDDADGAITAMRELLAETKDDDVRIGLASMLVAKNQWANAAQLLQEITLPYPAFGRIVSTWRLRLAVQAKDQGQVAALAKSLADAPLSQSQLSSLATSLDQVGLKGEAAPFRERAVAALSPEQFPGDVYRAFEELQKSGRRAEELALARRILAGSPRLAERSSGLASARQAALQALDRVGERAAYGEALEAKAMADPASLDDLLRYGEAVENSAKASAAWQRVLERDPKNERARQILASRTQVTGEPTIESLALQLANNPVQTMMQIDRFTTVYAKEKQFPQMAEQIVRATFPIAKTGASGLSPYVWTQLAIRFAEAGERAAAVTVLQKGLAVTDPRFGTNGIQELLVENLGALGRREEAARALADVFFPLPVASPPVLALRETVQRRTGATTNFALLDLGRRQGILGELQQRAETQSADDKNAQEVKMFLRCLSHDATVLPEFGTYLDGLPAGRSDYQWMLAMAGSLAGWPEAQPATQKLFDIYNRSLEKMDANTRASRRLELARAAVDSGSRELAVSLVRETVASLVANGDAGRALSLVAKAAGIAADAKEKSLLGECGQATAGFVANQTARGYLNQEEMFKLIDLLSAAGCTAEEAALTTELRKYATVKNDTGLSSNLELIATKADLARGTMDHATPIVWLDGARSTAEKAVIVWDIGKLWRYNYGGTTELTQGQPLPQFDGRFDVELFFGAREDSMQSLARLPKAKARGDWQGVLPSATGFVRVVFSDGNRFSFSDNVEVCAGQNQWGKTDSIELIPSLSAENLKVIGGGPAPGGSLLLYQPATTKDEYRTSQNIALRRVKLKPGANYVLSGWMRAREGRSLQLAVQFFRSDGQLINSADNVSETANRGFWAYQYVRMPAARRDHGDNARVRVPEGAESVEVLIRSDAAGFDLAAFSLVEAPPTPLENDNP